MYKTEMIRRVARETRLSQRVVAVVLAAGQRLIAERLRAGDAVRLPGFGTFYPSPRRAGTVRRIRTGRPVAVPAHTVAAFRAGAVLKRGIAESRRDAKRVGVGDLLRRAAGRGRPRKATTAA